MKNTPFALRALIPFLPAFLFTPQSSAQCPGQWHAMDGPSGFGNINAFQKMPDGSVIVAGYFFDIGGIPASCIARWDGTAWSTLGSGINSEVFALTLLPNGDVVAAGHFTMAGGVPAANIARWDGSSWSPLGPGIGNYVLALATLPNNDVVAGGYFVEAGGAPANHIARWNGTAWSPLGAGTDDRVISLLTLPNGNLFVGGAFGIAGGIFSPAIARWDGTTWHALAGGMNSYVYSLVALPNGDLLAGGSFTAASGVYAYHIARWNGSAWFGFGDGVGRNGGSDVFAISTTANGNIYVGGRFDVALETPVNNIARWNGSTWLPVTTGTNNAVKALTTLPNGDILLGGAFTTAGSLPSRRLARYTPITLAPAIARQPIRTSTCPTATAHFSVSATGTDPLSYLWQHESPANTWTDLAEGTNPGIGFFIGVHTSAISITNSGPASVSRYRVRITNSCATITSNPTVLTICRADFNCDTAVDFFDYLDFVQAFASNDPAADFNQDSTIDFFDYFEFVQAFSSGC